MRKPLTFILAMLTLHTAAALGQDKFVVIDSGAFASPEAARAAWQPAEENSPPIDTAMQAGDSFLHLPCNFATNDQWRVAWDRAGKWNLARCPRIELETVAEKGRAAELLLYFRSGDGWYSGRLTAPPGRSTLALARKQFATEGKPGAWDRIDRVRLCVLRNGTGNGSVLVRGLRGIVADTHVAIYRNDDGVKAESGIGEYARQMADRLDRIGVAYDLVGDAEVAAGALADMKVAILPLNPVLRKAASDAVEKFVADGGKLIVSYSLPRPLDHLLDLRNAGATEGNANNHAFEFTPAGEKNAIRVLQDSWWAREVVPLNGTTVRATWTNAKGGDTHRPAVTKNANGFFIAHVLTPVGETAKDQLILEMIGELWPGMWEAVYRRQETQLAPGERIARLLAAAGAAKPGTSGDREAALLKAEAEKMQSLARDAAAHSDWQGAVMKLERCFDLAIRAWATSIPPKPGEIRAVWCHSPTGVAGLSWDQAMVRLADAGLNAIIVNMLWGGSTAYPSKVLPRGTDFAGDPLADCLAAAKKHGIAVHVWKVDWNLAWTCPESFRRKMRAAGRLQVGPQGQPIDWLCPSNPDNQKLELDSILELVRNYQIDGFHFDYIRYPGNQGCFCPTCRKAFEARIGRALDHWPDDVLSGLRHKDWLDFRRDNITRLVAAVADQARKVRPGLKISAAVFANWQVDRDSVGQDWKLWVDRGYLDFVCPMQYTDSAALFAARTRTHRELTAGHAAKLLTGIGATLGLTRDGTLEQVLIARRDGADGFVLFNFTPELLPHLELLRLGATRPISAPASQ